MSARATFSPPLTASALACALLLVALPSVVDARDTDGSRLGAEKHELGTTDVDSLAPPDDTADWRYVEIESKTTVVFILAPNTEGASLTMTLTKATGEETDSTSTEGDEVTIEHDLAPGLYYIGIESDDEREYEFESVTK